MTTKGARTRQKIVHQALQVFSVKGYFNTSVADLLAAREPSGKLPVTYSR